MNVFAQFRLVVLKALEELTNEGSLPKEMNTERVTCEPPKDPSHGDIATNAAMVLAKDARRNPREIATHLVEKLSQNPYVESCELAGPGFVNLRLSDHFWRDQLQLILKEETNYGSSKIGEGRKVNVEYVSVNPTGPMHVGHSRVALVGDVLASLLKKAGFEVTKEFYINDAGAQTLKLAQSVYNRYLEALGHKVTEVSEYPGEYLIPVGQALAEKEKERLVSMSTEEWMPIVRPFAIQSMMDLIKEDLDVLDIHHDVFTSEQAIIDSGALEEAFKELDKKGLIYVGQLPKPKGKVLDDWEPRDLTLFKTTAYGDDQDRPLKKSDGTWTYIMGDIAYHRDKIKRGYDILVNVWGMDHIGYVKRLRAATQALSEGKVPLDVTLCALVNFLEKGEPLKMSKRAGTFIAVRDVIERVGLDATRFMMVSRKNDIPLDFDFAKVVEQSKDNPVYYVQYAHARCCSIRRHVERTFPSLDLDSKKLGLQDLKQLTEPEDIAMIKVLTQWPKQVEVAAENHEPHRLAYYLYEIAATFHGLWAKGKEESELRFIFPEDEEKTYAKFALVQGVANIIASGLEIFGVNPVEEM